MIVVQHYYSVVMVSVNAVTQVVAGARMPVVKLPQSLSDETVLLSKQSWDSSNDAATMHHQVYQVLYV
jgi:hypothetical protein